MTATAQNPLITRKEIAQMLGPNVTPRQVANHEKDWGLDRARVSLGTRQVMFRYAVVVFELRQRGAM